MSYTDKQITCSDCVTAFTFSAGEQESFASRGYTNEPKRCPICRIARKQNTSGSSSYGSGGSGNSNYSSAPRQMFPVKCATCGKDTQVPFEPRAGRPVYCSDCYRKTNPEKRYQLSGDDYLLGRAAPFDRLYPVFCVSSGIYNWITIDQISLTFFDTLALPSNQLNYPPAITTL